MNPTSYATIYCQNCGAPMPPSKQSWKPKLYCRKSCRKAVGSIRRRRRVQPVFAYDNAMVRWFHQPASPGIPPLILSGRFVSQTDQTVTLFCAGAFYEVAAENIRYNTRRGQA